MCPLRVFLLLFSALIAGYAAFRALAGSAPLDDADDDASEGGAEGGAGSDAPRAYAGGGCDGFVDDGGGGLSFRRVVSYLLVCHGVFFVAPRCPPMFPNLWPYLRLT